MGKEAMFVLNCGHSAQSVLDIIRIWLDHEWCIYNSEGMAWYCDIGDDEGFYWKSAHIDMKELTGIIAATELKNELVAVKLFDANDVGFTVLSRDTSEIIIGLDYNRKTISEGYTDVSWYYDAIIKLLIMNGCKPEHIEYSEL